LADRGQARFIIELPQHLLDSLSEVLQGRLLAAIDRVMYSPLGSNVMKKLKGMGEGKFRIAFSGNRAILRKDGNGIFHVTDIIKRDSQTYNITRRRIA